MSASRPSIRTCPRCASAIPADAPLGLCPKCVVGSGFGLGVAGVGRECEVGQSGDGSSADLGTVGRYRLLELIGEGGFGEVYRAEQQEPVRRMVALKVIKRGMDTRQVIARFEGERQALAILDHPNIAQVFDADETPDGRPYFVMELVQGESITEFASREKLDLRARLDLFGQVLAGIEHAHQRGIIHRDLKPSNILVRPDGGARGGGVPVIIDFGVAKATQHVLSDKTIYTEVCQFVGTPEYMSPEQAATSGEDVDTRSDVYSLGIILYELLSNSTPFGRGSGGEPPSLRSRMSRAFFTPEAILRDVREIDPPTPSSKLKAVENEVRGPVRWREVRGELDWIVAKAMEKERARRYGSVREMADDLARLLAGEPVSARSPSRIYRLRKFVRRHRAGVAAMACIVISLMVATPVSVSMAWRARRAQEAERRTFSRSDLQMAGEFAANDNPSLAVAHLARALRTDPGNEAATFKLLALLAYENFPVAATAPLPHSEFVRAASWSPAGTILTACDDGSLRLWEAATGQLLGEPGDHQHRIEMVALSPTGEWFAAGSWDGRARVWDARTGQAVTPWLRHEREGLLALAFHPEGKYLAGAASNGEVLFWSLRDGRLLWRRQAASHHVLAFSEDGLALAVAGNEASVTLWELDQNREVVHSVASPLVPDGGYVTRAVWLSSGMDDGGRLALATANGLVRIWNVAQGTITGESMRHFRSAWALASSPDHTRWASGSHDGTARLWDSRTVSPVCRELVHRDPIYHVAFTRDGSRLITIGNASRPGTPAARVWDAVTGSPVTAPIYHPQGAYAFAISPDGRQLATGSRDRTLRVWDIRLRAAVPATIDLRAPVWSTRFTADGARLVCWSGAGSRHVSRATDDGRGVDERGSVPESGGGLTSGLRADRSRTWQDRTENFLAPEFREGVVLSAAYGLDGERLATGGRDGLVRIWNRATRSLEGPPLRHSSPVTAVAFTRAGGPLVTACRDGSVHAWNLESGECTASAQAHDGPIWCLVAYGARFVVTGSEDKTARIWRFHENVLSPPLGHQDPVRQAAVSADGKRVATGTSVAKARVWEAVRGVPLSEDLAHESGTGDWGVLLRFTPDGRRLITTGTYDNSARIWEIETSELAFPPLLHDAPVSACDVDAEGKLLATGSNDRRVRLWHLGSGELLSPPFVETHEVIAVAFDPGGRRLVSGCLDGMVTIRDLPPWTPRAPDWLPDAAEALAGMALDRGGRALPLDAGPGRRLPPEGQLDRSTPLGKWVMWLFADPERRPVSPWWGEVQGQ